MTSSQMEVPSGNLFSGDGQVVGMELKLVLGRWLY